MTPQQVGQLRRRITRHVAAQVALSWIGSKFPDEHGPIELEAERAANSLQIYLESLKK